MKRIALLLPLLAAVSAAAAPTASSNWKTIATATDAAPAMAYDAARTRYETPYLTTWTRVVPAAPAKLNDGRDYRSVLQKIAIDCATHAWGVTYSEFHATRDASDEAIFFYTVPADDWDLRPARKNTNGARLVNALCATSRGW